MNFLSNSSKATQKIAGDLAQKILQAPRKKGAFVVGLIGDLGAGKTTFIQGFTKGLGLRCRVSSPTFIIFRRHALPSSLRSASRRRSNPTCLSNNPKDCFAPVATRSRNDARSLLTTNYKYLYHMDAYRLKNTGDTDALNFEKIVANPENIVLIEWANQIKKSLPKNTLWIKFEYGQKENERAIEFK